MIQPKIDLTNIQVTKKEDLQKLEIILSENSYLSGEDLPNNNDTSIFF